MTVYEWVAEGLRQKVRRTLAIAIIIEIFCAILVLRYIEDRNEEGEDASVPAAWVIFLAALPIATVVRITRLSNSPLRPLPVRRYRLPLTIGPSRLARIRAGVLPLGAAATVPVLIMTPGSVMLSNTQLVTIVALLLIGAPLLFRIYRSSVDALPRLWLTDAFLEQTSDGDRIRIHYCDLACAEFETQCQHDYITRCQLVLTVRESGTTPIRIDWRDIPETLWPAVLHTIRQRAAPTVLGPIAMQMSEGQVFAHAPSEWGEGNGRD